MYIQRALRLVGLLLVVGITTGCDDATSPNSGMPDGMMSLPDMAPMPRPDPAVTDVAIQPEIPRVGDPLSVPGPS